MRISPSNNEGGFTLLELIVAMVISVVGLLGLLQSLNIATEYNRKNQLRDEAVLIGEEQLNWLRAQPYDTALDVYTSNFIGRQSQWGYRITKKSVPIAGSSSKELVVRVAWSYRNVTSAHEVHSITTQQ